MMVIVNQTMAVDRGALTDNKHMMTGDKLLTMCSGNKIELEGDAIVNM